MRARARLRAHGETLACWTLGAVALWSLVPGATGFAQLILTGAAGACTGAAVQLAGNCLMGGA